MKISKIAKIIKRIRRLDIIEGSYSGQWIKTPNGSYKVIGMPKLDRNNFISWFGLSSIKEELDGETIIDDNPIYREADQNTAVYKMGIEVDFLGLTYVCFTTDSGRILFVDREDYDILDDHGYDLCLIDTDDGTIIAAYHGMFLEALISTVNMGHEVGRQLLAIGKAAYSAGQEESKE